MTLQGCVHNIPMLLNLILINGLSFIFFILLQLNEVKTSLTSFLPWFLIIFSFPHFMLTYWIWVKRVGRWHDEWPAILFPFFYSALFFVIYFYPMSFLTIDELIRFSYAYLLYHFVQQLFGVTLWLSYQYRIALMSWQKRALRAFFLMSGLYAYFDLELRGGAKVLFYREISQVSLSSDFVIGSFILVGLLFVINLGFIVKNYLETKSLRSFAPLGGMLVAGLWFIPPFGHQMVLFLPVLHAFQYFPFIVMKERSQKKWRLTVLFAGAIGAGWILFRVLPFSTLQFLSPDVGLIFPAFVLTLLNNHHFVIDGRIWKLRDERNKELFLAAKIPGDGQGDES